jgi:glycosyltransferase involved in cell wall biosynthesis
VPALNEERTIAKIVIRALENVDRVLVVDDGSKDDTAIIAKKLGAVVLKHNRNLGKGAALRDCFSWAKRNGADILVTLDADGQHDPSDIPKLVRVLEGGKADVAIGSRLSRPERMPRHRWVAARALDFAAGVQVGDRVLDSQSGFRAYSRKAIETLVVTDSGMGADAELVMRASRTNFRIVEVPIAVHYDRSVTSRHNQLIHGLDVLFSIVKFTSIRHPLLFYGGFALVSMITSLYFGFATIDYYQKEGRVITNLALISVASGLLGFLALFTGVILFTLIGIVRERRTGDSL